MVAEVLAVGLGGGGVDVVRPDNRVPGLDEAEVESARAAEKRDDLHGIDLRAFFVASRSHFAAPVTASIDKSPRLFFPNLSMPRIIPNSHADAVQPCGDLPIGQSRMKVKPHGRHAP